MCRPPPGKSDQSLQPASPLTGSARCCLQHTYETRVRWTNDLVDANGNYIPHLLKEAIDQTLVW
jgi:hypothetical protein